MSKKMIYRKLRIKGIVSEIIFIVMMGLAIAVLILLLVGCTASFKVSVTQVDLPDCNQPLDERIESWTKQDENTHPFKIRVFCNQQEERDWANAVSIRDWLFFKKGEDYVPPNETD